MTAPTICRLCDPPHVSRAVPSTLDRDALGYAPRPPAVACPWCHAGPGEACRPSHTKRGRLTRTPGGCHPARLEVAA